MEELLLCCFLRGHYEEVTKKVKPEEDSGKKNLVGVWPIGLWYADALLS